MRTTVIYAKNISTYFIRLFPSDKTHYIDIPCFRRYIDPYHHRAADLTSENRVVRPHNLIFFSPPTVRPSKVRDISLNISFRGLTTRVCTSFYINRVYS